MFPAPIEFRWPFEVLRLESLIYEGEQNGKPATDTWTDMRDELSDIVLNLTRKHHRGNNNQWVERLGRLEQRLDITYWHTIRITSSQKFPDSRNSSIALVNRLNQSSDLDLDLMRYQSSY